VCAREVNDPLVPVNNHPRQRLHQVRRGITGCIDSSARTGELSDVRSQARRARLFLSTRTGVKLDYKMNRADERARPEDVGEQALIRGLDTAFPFVRLGLSRSKVGRRSKDRPRRVLGSSPAVAPPSLLHD